jgi:hypothetical protein
MYRERERERESKEKGNSTSMVLEDEGQFSAYPERDAR